MFSSQAHTPAEPVPDLVPGGRRGAAALVLALACTALASCSGDTARTLALDAGYGPKAVTAPDFVAASRPRETPDFMDVGVDAPRRATRAKSPEAQKSLEAELEGARGRNESRGRAAESAGKGTSAAVKPVQPAVP